MLHLLINLVKNFMLLAEAIQFQYPNSKKLIYPYIKCNIQEPLLITGESGCGKTTLLSILGGLINNYDGKVIIDGTNISNLTKTELDKFRAENIGIIHQKSFFVSSLNMKDNIRLASYFGKGQKQNNDIFQHLSSQLKVDHLQLKQPDELSSGELQRFSIIRAICKNAKLILADEPTSSLDNRNAHQVIQLLNQLCLEKDIALIIVSHDTRLTKIFSHQINLTK